MNLGSNHVAGCGKFEGGGIYCYGLGVLNVKNRLHEFVGALPHMSLAASGTRFTIIWFVPTYWERANPYCREYLKQLGFTIPSATTEPRFLVTSIQKARNVCDCEYQFCRCARARDNMKSHAGGEEQAVG